MSSSVYADEILKVKTLLKEFERYSKKSLGQNFLINRQKIELIVESVKNIEPQNLIEIGPGLGALTDHLKNITPQFSLIELDDLFSDHWEKKGLTVLRGDALRVDWSQLTKTPSVLVSNLPYQIAARLVVDLSVGANGIETMVLMFQKEVAQRISAKVKTGDYGLLAVIAQTFWDVKILTDLGPNDYYPPPKVASRVLTFTKKRGAEAYASKAFLTFCKTSFSQQRKYLKKNLSVMAPEGSILDAFKELGLSPQARPGDISIDLYQKLYKLLSV